MSTDKRREMLELGATVGGALVIVLTVGGLLAFASGLVDFTGMLRFFAAAIAAGVVGAAIWGVA